MRRYYWWFLILFFTVFSLLPTIYEIANRNSLQPDRAFELVHNFPTDYNFYLSRIRQGIEGRLTIVEKYTSEQHSGSFLQVFYLILGWFGKVVRIPANQSYVVYHTARLFFGMVLLWYLSRIVDKLFKKTIWKVIAMLVILTAGSWPIVNIADNKLDIYGYMRWWTVSDPLQRLLFIPHLLVGQAILIYLTNGLFHVLRMKNPRIWLFYGFLACILGVIFPPGLLFFYVMYVIYISIVYLKTSHKFRYNTVILFLRENIFPAIVIIGISFPALLYVQLMVTFYPWKRLIEFDQIHPTSFNTLEYLKAVGPVYIFGILGGIIAIIKNEKKYWTLVSYVLAWQLLIEIFRRIPQTSALRLTQVGIHIPLGILSTYVFVESAAYGKRLITRASPMSSIIGFIAKILSVLIPFTMIAVGFLLMFFSMKTQVDFIDHKMRATIPLVPAGSYVMYPLKDFISTLTYMEKNIPKESIILSDTTAGNYIPVYSGHTVYLGHDNTVGYEKKINLMRTFFRGQMIRESAALWIEKENINYVFFGPQEKENGAIKDLISYYPFLKQIYENSYVTLYWVDLDKSSVNTIR